MAQSKKTRPACPAVRAILKALEEHYQSAHPAAVIDCNRQNSASIRIRIIDPDSQELDRALRHDLIWGILHGLSEDIQSQITVLLLLTPKETKKSIANMDFENPIPSNL